MKNNPTSAEILDEVLGYFHQLRGVTEGAIEAARAQYADGAELLAADMASRERMRPIYAAAMRKAKKTAQLAGRLARFHGHDHVEASHVLDALVAASEIGSDTVYCGPPPDDDPDDP